MNGLPDREPDNGLCRGKVALVTGAASGIGRAAAQCFAREGARVVAVDRSQDGVADLVRQLQDGGANALAIAADVSSQTDVVSMVNVAIDRFGRLDCAFNNAGIGGAETGSAGKRTAEIPLSGWDRIIATNLTGVWLCMVAEIEAMLKGGGGVIVNTASIGGVLGLAQAGAYTASKHGVVGLTRAAAIEYGADLIRVNAVCPGYIETPLIQAGLDERRAALTRRTPLRRLGTPEEIAELVVWLCSDRASFVTGSIYMADGGYAAG